MSDDRSRLLDDILDGARERVGDQRAAYLNKACGDDGQLRTEIESLLDRELGDFLETPAVECLESWMLVPEPLEEGTRVGAYEIVRMIGSGGSGTLYEAESQQPRRRVALKVMRSGLGSKDAVRRFEAEAEILAQLNHPSIAHVYDTGVHEADGIQLPYFALEYVEGAQPITTYAEAAGLSIRQKLDLFARLCDAIHHAHGKRAIHRDLKPANVLVGDDGRLRVIDFGIALVRELDKGPEKVAGTLPYMSPEQVSTGLDERSDVYALGVLLYEMLTGRLPHDVSRTTVAEAARTIRGEEPSPIQSHDRRLRGDISAIVHSAMHRVREKRYDSAQELGDDVRRYLRNEPVHARPASLRHRMRLLARRRASWVAAGCVALLVLAGATAILMVFAARTERAQKAAVDAAAREEFETYLGDIAAAADALRRNDVRMARQHLEHAPKQLRNWEWRYMHGSLDTSVETLRSELRISHGTTNDDGTLAVARCWDLSTGVNKHHTQVWDLENGERMHAFPNASYETAFAFDPTNFQLWIGYASGAVEVRELSDGSLAATLQAHDQTINAIVFAPGGTVATASRDKTIKLWDAATRQPRATLLGHDDRVVCLSIDAAGRRLASGCRDGTIRIWNVESHKTIRILGGANDVSVEGVAFSPDGRRLAVSRRDGWVELWDAISGKLIATRQHAAMVRDIAFAFDGKTFASASWDTTVKVWGATDARLWATLRGHQGLVESVRYTRLTDESGNFSESGLVSFSRDGAIKHWDLERCTPLFHNDRVTALDFSPDSQSLASASLDGTCKIWDVHTRRRLLLLDHGGNHPTFAAFRHNGSQLLTTPHGDYVRIWSLPKGTDHKTSLRFGSQSVALWREGTVLVGSNDGVSVYQLEPMRFRGRADAENVSLGALAAHSESGTFATGAQDGSVQVWREQQGSEGSTVAFERLANLKLHHSQVRALALSRDGRILATGSYDNTIKLIDTKTFEVRATLVHGSPLQSLAFTPDGTRLASGSVRGGVRLWDVASGRHLLTLDGPASVFRLAFSPDGKVLACGGGVFEDENPVVLWEAR